ncbi:hypothetical protein VitviT2T_021379 [Vitis vinifera]|uniref:AT-hook motif nuclear-localized protein n=1 Tax=Vitis vinifera TaxID=29760 RepID=A0ABY9D6T7_VITVI|nr:hypothetical protein VitviT2T_021379 [Vitis vinifera]
MEPNDTRLTSYFHHHQQQPQPPPPPPPQPQPHHQTQNPVAATAASPSNGLLPPSERPPLGYHHSVPSAVTSPPETVRRKRGRPRKYGTSEQGLSAKKSPSSSVPVPKKKEQGLGGSSKKSQLVSLGNAGQSFTPHVITVASGEDVAQKIMFFMQQSKREICIMSASGSISNASLRQPATSGGNVAYEGRFEILSLTGSYVRTEIGGRTGGLSVCLSNTDGEIIGGGVGGPLKAAGPVQVIVGTFLVDSKKDTSTGLKADASPKFTSPVGGASVSNVGFRSAVESSGRIPVMGNDDHQGIGGSHFMIQSRGMQMAPTRPTDWRSGPDARINVGYDLAGKFPMEERLGVERWED